jgi:hypothetical protein
LKLLLIPLICIASLLQAQHYDTNKYGPCSQIRFSAMPALYNNLDYQNTGPQLFRSSVGIGGEFVLSYRQAIWKGLGLNAGGGIGFVPYNFSFEIVPDSSSILFDQSGELGHIPNTGMEFILTFPLILEKKFLLFPEDKLFLNLEAGIKWNIKLNSGTTSGGSYWTQTADDEDVRYFEYRFTNVGESEFLSFVFKAGLLKVNRKGNSFTWNIVLQRSSTSILTGTYRFNELGPESFGTTDLYNSYIGMELIYAMSLDRKDKISHY